MKEQHPNKDVRSLLSNSVRQLRTSAVIVLDPTVEAQPKKKKNIRDLALTYYTDLQPNYKQSINENVWSCKLSH